MDDPVNESIAHIEALAEPGRSIAKLLVEAGQWTMAGLVAGVRIDLLTVDGVVLTVTAGGGTNTLHIPRQTHIPSEARH
jgi:hypothetical protein